MSKSWIVIIAIILSVVATSCISSSGNRERKNKSFTKAIHRMNLRKL